MGYSDPFSIKPIDYIYKELFTLDLDSEECEKEVLAFLNAHWLSHTRDNKSKIDDYYENMGYYLGFGRVPITKSHEIQLLAADSSAYFRRIRPQFARLRVNRLQDIVENKVSRYSIRKPSFIVYPKHGDITTSKKKVTTARHYLSWMKDYLKMVLMEQELIRRMFIFGEIYLETYWDPEAGPDMFDKDEKRERVPLKDDNGNIQKSEDGEPLYINKKLKLGEIASRIIDPDRIIVKDADSFAKADWVIILDYMPVSKARVKWPEHADEIKATSGIEHMNSRLMTIQDLPDHTIVYTLYHRTTPEMPDGRIIKATPHCILENRVFDADTLIDQDLFPVQQLTEYSPPQSSRGIAQTMNTVKPIQLMQNNIANRFATNIAKFPPIRISEAGSIDEDLMRTGNITDIKVKPGAKDPYIMQANLIPQDQSAFFDKLDELAMKLSNVLPPSRAEAMPNVESRKMLDYYDDKETAQSLTLDDKIQQFLTDWARLLLAFAAAKYKDTPTEKKKRALRILGPNKPILESELNIEDLKEPFDLSIDTQNTFADTFNGRIQQIKDLNSVAPGMLSPAKILSELELGNVEETGSTLTRAIDLAREEIQGILIGKKPKSPQPYLDLLPYYEEYLKALSLSEIREILPEKYDPEGSGKGQWFLDQVLTIESLIWDAIENQKAQGILVQGLTPLQTQLAQRFPMFPSIYKPVAVAQIDPNNLQPSEQPPPPQEGMMGNQGMGESPMPLNPNPQGEMNG